jgi:hypothetical protein
LVRSVWGEGMPFNKRVSGYEAMRQEAQRTLTWEIAWALSQRFTVYLIQLAHNLARCVAGKSKSRVTGAASNTMRQRDRIHNA